MLDNTKQDRDLDRGMDSYKSAILGAMLRLLCNVSQYVGRMYVGRSGI